MSEAPRQIALGPAFAVTSEDPGWMNKALMQGLCGLIPFVAAGYRKRVYTRAQAGEMGFPEIDIGEDFVGGLRGC